MKAAGGLIALLVLSMAGNLLLGFTVLDRAHAREDRDHDAKFTRASLSDLRRIADRFGRFPARSEAKQALSTLFAASDDVVKWEGDTLWVNEVGLSYADSVARVVFMNEVN